MTEFYKLSASEAKKKYPILTDYDLKKVQRDQDGLYNTEELRARALKKALSDFSKNNQSKEEGK